MLLQQTIRAIILCLLVIPSFFFGMDDSSNTVTRFDRTVSLSVGVCSVGAAFLAFTISTFNDIPVHHRLVAKLAYAPLLTAAMLFITKARSDATWADIMHNKKTILAKYFLFGSLANIGFCEILQLNKSINGTFPTRNNTERAELKLGTGIVLAGLGILCATKSNKDLKKLLKAPRDE